jgi:hypothetical protein
MADLDPSTLTDEQKASAQPIPPPMDTSQPPGRGPDGQLPYAADRAAANAQMRKGAFNVNNINYSDQVKPQASVDAQITGAPDAQKGPSAPPIQPHEFSLQDYDPQTLKAAAKAGGIDTSLLPDSYWQKMSDKYSATIYPGELQKAQMYINASGIGHFMQGWEDGEPSDSIAPEHLARMFPGSAEEMKANAFFGANIQARIIDKGQFIDKQSGNYNPPTSYKAGHILGTMISQPGNVAIPQGAKMAAMAALQGLAGAARTTSAWIAANPIAGKILTAAASGSAFGAAMKIFGNGGGAPPPVE